MPLGAARFGFIGGGVVPLEAEWFATAGGGGSGGNQPRSAPLCMPGGGGGGGGTLSNNDSGLELATWELGTTYAMSTGSGGARGTGYDTEGDVSNPGSAGGDTTWNDATNGTLTLKGGGGGGSGFSGTGYSGGSGGGAGGTVSANGGAALVLTPSQGYAGGNKSGYFVSASGGGKGGAGNNGSANNPGDSPDGLTWVNSIEYAVGGRGSDRQYSIVGAGHSSASAGTGNGGPSRYQSNVDGLNGGSGVIGIKFPDAYTLSNPGGGLTITSSTADGYTTAIITGTGNIQFD